MGKQLAVTKGGVHRVGKTAHLTVDGVHRKVKKAYLTAWRTPQKEYAILEYIEATGTQYVYLNTPLTTSGRFSIGFQFTQFIGSDDDWILSTYNGQSAGMLLGNNTGAGTVNLWSRAQGTQTSTASMSERCDFSYDLATGAAVINGEAATFAAFDPGTLGATLFRRSAEDSPVYARIYYFDYTEGDTPVLNVVPARRLADGAVGLYDRVNKVFYPNSGTGEFTAGAETGEYIYDIEEEMLAHHLVFGAGYDQLVNYTMLYEYGDEHTDVTGGWVGFSINNYTGAFWSKGSTYLEFGDSGVGYGSGGFYAENSFDLSEYSCIWADLQLVSFSAPTYGAQSVAGFGSTSSPASYFICSIASSAARAKKAKVYDQSLVTPGTPQRVATWGWSGGANADSNKGRCYAFALGKADDWAALCALAGVTAPATLAELIADTTAISAILANEDAVLYMTRRCTGDFMMCFATSSDCRTALASSPYSATVYDNEHWNKFLSYST